MSRFILSKESWNILTNTNEEEVRWVRYRKARKADQSTNKLYSERLKQLKKTMWRI